MNTIKKFIKQISNINKMEEECVKNIKMQEFKNNHHKNNYYAIHEYHLFNTTGPMWSLIKFLNICEHVASFFFKPLLDNILIRYVLIYNYILLCNYLYTN